MNITQKKAIMGVGMLLLFVATLLVSVVAAGVLIQTTGLMQESARAVAEDARNQLVTGLNVPTVYALGNTSQSEVYGLEFYTRLRAGSPAIQMDNVGYNFVAGQTSIQAELNESLAGDQCSFDNLTTDEFCYETLSGNNDTILQTGELLNIKHYLGNDSEQRLQPDEDFEATLQIQATGSTKSIQATVPDLILDSKIRLR